MNELKNTAKHTIIYSFGNLSVKIIGLILLPLYTSKLSVSDYGKLGLLEVTAQFMIVVFGLNIYTAMIRWCSDSVYKEKKKSIVFTSFVSLITVLIALNICLIPLREKLSELYFQSNAYSIIFLLVFCTVSLEILNNLILNLLRMEEESLKYIIFIIIKLVVVLAFNIYFVAFLQIGVKGIFLSQCIGNGMIFIVNLQYIFKKMEIRFQPKILKEMIFYSIPLIFSSVSIMLLSMGDRFYIKYFLDDEQVGIYSLAYKIAGVLNMILVQSFSLSFLPIAYKMLGNDNAKEFYKNVYHYYSITLLIFAFLISLFSKEVLEIFTANHDYVSAHKIVPILCLTFVFKGLQNVFALGFHYIKQTKFNAYIVFIGLILNFGLNILLIPKIGIWGASIATVISSFVNMSLFYFLVQKKYYVGYEVKIFWQSFLIFTTLYFISLSFQYHIFLNAAIKILLFLSSLSLLILFKIIKINQLDIIKYTKYIRINKKPNK